MSNSTAPVVNVATLIGKLTAGATRRTDVINAIVARELQLKGTNANGSFKVSAVANDLGIDKGNVSRIGKMLAALPVATQKKINSLSITSINPDDESSMSDAAILGKLLRRDTSGRKPAKQDADKSTAAPSGASSEADTAAAEVSLEAVAFDAVNAWLASAENDKQLAAFIAMLNDWTTRATKERAAA